MSEDLRAKAAAFMASLVGPAGPFELAPEDVLGASIPNFVNRTRSLPELLAKSLEFGDREYLVTKDRKVTFTEHAALVGSLAQELRDTYDIQPGDRVAIAAANSIEWILTFWATVGLGGVVVGCNAWWTAKELEHGLGITQPKVLVADAKRAALAQEIASEDAPLPVLSIEEDIPRLAAAHPDAPLPAVEVPEDDPIVILFTSGTSGRPKGAVHSSRNLLSVVEYHKMNDVLAQAFGDPTNPQDRRYLLMMPLFHVGSLHNLTVPRIANGSTAVLYEGSFDVDRVLSLVEQERVTNWGAVPTMASRMMEHGGLDKYDTSSLTAFALASAPSSPAFHERIRQQLPFGATMANSYGLTECCTAVSVATAMDLAQAPSTLGRPIVGVQVEVRDAAGKALPPGVDGEVCVRSPYVMRGYWNNEEATRQAIREDRWLHTGDIGQLDDQGRLSLASRRSDLIIRGGENIYPAEVENVLDEHPAVAEVVVIGVPSEDLGQEVGAIVVVRAPVSEEGLTEYCKEHLAYFKVPKFWRITDQPLFRNATGKVVRAGLSL